MIQKNAIVLFQGDSITDAGRNYADGNDLGHGYAMLTAAWFSALHPDKNVTFLNRGISGNRIKDLQDRWKVDCLDIKPDWVSILIGVNDCWRRYDSNDPTSAEAFAAGYRDILQQIKDHLSARVILIEPFVLPVPEDRKQWREDLDPKIHAVRELAREFEALYIPMDGVFSRVSTQQPPAYWAGDGVHPTMAGHALMAQEWLKTVQSL